MDERWKFVQEFLEKQSERGLRRILRPRSALKAPGKIKIGGEELLDLSSNDYLGLKNDARLAKAMGEAARRWGSGSGASRLISGTTELHERVEAALARFHGCGAALTFSSGYAAGVGLIPAFAGRGDRAYLDRLCHASLYDGAILSGARLERFRHNDPGHLRELLERDSGRGGRALVVTDTVFSMDGDRAPLAELSALCRTHCALFIADEAHAVGVLGPGGRGLAAEQDLGAEDVLVLGTLGKAFGVSGAYVACAPEVRDYLINTCRSFIFSTAPPPPLLAAVEKALEIVLEADSQRAHLLDMAQRLRRALHEKGISTLESSTQIVPALAGEPRAALDFAERLRREKIFAPAVRPPTVPPGTSRVRFSLSAALSEKDFEYLLEVLGRVVG